LGVEDEKEEIVYATGLLYLNEFDMEIEPSFGVIIERNEEGSPVLKFDHKIFKELIKKRDEEKEEALLARDILNPEPFSIFDKKEGAKIDKILREVSPAFKQLGISEDEQNSLVLGALAHESCPDDVTPEGIVGLALKIRGEG